METYKPDESAEWPFIPTGDGATCKENPPPKHWLLQNVHIKPPLCRRGYLYGYHENQFVRTKLPSFEVLQEICDIADTLYKGPVLGMNQSKTRNGICELVFALRTQFYAVPTKEAMEIISPDKIYPLITATRRLKLVPEGLIDSLSRLATLHGKLEYIV